MWIPLYLEKYRFHAAFTHPSGSLPGLVTLSTLSSSNALLNLFSLLLSYQAKIMSSPKLFCFISTTALRRFPSFLRKSLDSFLNCAGGIPTVIIKVPNANLCSSLSQSSPSQLQAGVLHPLLQTPLAYRRLQVWS